MKVIEKPVIEDMNTNLLNVDFEYEGVTHTIRIHPTGSSREFFASRSFLSASENEAERLASWYRYCAALVDGWDSLSNDFFGGEHSHQHVEKICMNPKNTWFIGAISKALTDDSKK